MRILELLLPKNISDKSLSPQTVNKIDALQKRMNGYIDKIGDPSTSNSGREFLKSKLRTDYNTLKDEIQRISEEANEQESYELYDRKTGAKVPNRGPYFDKSRARKAVDKLDLEYGAVKYGYRPIKKPTVTESVNKIPLSNDDFELFKKIFEHPIPAAVAPIYILEVIDDDSLTDELNSLVDSEPNRDVRPIVAEWFKRVMPDQMYRFTNDLGNETQRKGILSPLHGYDPKMFKGTNDAITGNAYGKF